MDKENKKVEKETKEKTEEIICSQDHNMILYISHKQNFCFWYCF